MKYYIINSSPRKKYNTSQLLEKAAQGIKDTLKDKNEDISIETINLLNTIIPVADPASYVNKKTAHSMENAQ